MEIDMKLDPAEKQKLGLWFVGGVAVGLTLLSMGNASVPLKNVDALTGGPILNPEVSELNVAPEAEPRFDGSVRRLTQLENSGRYYEHLPGVRTGKKIKKSRKKNRLYLSQLSKFEKKKLRHKYKKKRRTQRRK